MIGGLLLRFIVNILALWLTVVLAQQFHIGLTISSFFAAAAAVIVLGFVNTVIGPILRLLMKPLTCMTLGLFTFVINAFLFWFVSWLVPGFGVHGPGAALFGSVVMGVLQPVLQSLTDSLIGSRS